MIAVGGAGLTGAVIARQLADQGIDVTVFDPRDHVAGNCHTERINGVQVHTYGPHIFHTDNPTVWEYVNRWMTMVPYRHTVKATIRGEVFPMPINLGTINQWYRTRYTPSEARAAIQSVSEGSSFQAEAIRTIGPELYEAFFEYYTLKMWGRHPRHLPASVFQRLPVRFTYDDNYYHHQHQAMPKQGYTEMVARILDHPRIQTRLEQPLDPSDVAQFDHTFWTGPVDLYFDHAHGRLPYRTIDFQLVETADEWQGCAQMMWPDPAVPWTRTVEHNLLAPWEHHDRTIATIETPREAETGDPLFYPVHTDTTTLVDEYADLARHEPHVTFCGRLGTFRYIDMDQAIAEALSTAQHHLETLCSR